MDARKRVNACYLRAIVKIQTTSITYLRTGLICIAASCTVLLLREYLAFRQHNQQLIALKGHYRVCLETLRKQQPIVPAQEKTGMTMLNRTPAHLQTAALGYLEQQKLSHLAEQLDGTSWAPYTDHLLHTPQPTKPMHTNKKSSTNKSTSTTKSTLPRAIEKRSSTFIWPIEPTKFWLSSLFGPRKSSNGSRFHRGIDMASPRGTPIRAAASGRVIEARRTAGYGNTIVISHAERYKTRYAHMERILAKTGQRVKQGETIGTVGDTGFTISAGKEGTHLHFELHSWGKLVNPLHMLPTRKGRPSLTV